MDAIYSPSTQTFALIPRLSSSSSSSSSSVRLSFSRIQSVRDEFLGCSSKLRHRSRRKCKWMALNVSSNRNSGLQLVASLNSLSIVAVVVAMTMSAATAAAAYSKFHYSRRKKKDLDEASGPSASERDQEVGVTSKQGLYDPSDGERLHIVAPESNESTPRGGEHIYVVTPESNYSVLAEGDSTPEDKDSGVKLLYHEHSSLPEDAPNAEQLDLPDSNLTDLGAFASALSEKSENLDIALPEEHSEFLSVQSLEICAEVSEVADAGTNTDLDHILLAHVVEINGAMSGAVESAPTKDNDKEVSEVAGAGTVTDLDHILPAPVVEMNAVMSGAVKKAPTKDNGTEVSEFTGVSTNIDLDQIPPPAPAAEVNGAMSVAVKTDPTKDNDMGVSEFTGVSMNIDLDRIPLPAAAEVNGAISGAVETAATKNNGGGQSNHVHDESHIQASFCKETTKAGREELHLFFDDTSMSEQSAFTIENFLGAGGNISAASHTEGFLQERKVSLNGKARPRSDIRDLRKSEQNSTDVPDTYKVKHSATSNMSLYHSLLKSGRLNKCIELLEDMNKKNTLDMSKIYHAKFFDICRSQKAVKEAFHFSKLIPNPTLSTFNMLMSVCSSAQDSEGAFEVWQLAQAAGFKADCKLYTTLISTCAKSGKVDTMFEVFHDMVNRGIEPNVHTYGALIDGCARAGQVAKAFGAYGILRSKNVKPDRVVFNALITACGQSRAVERAFDVLAEMRAEAQPIDPDHVTVGALIGACTSAGQLDRVKGVYEMMDKYNIKGTPELYTIAVNSCSHSGDWEFACNIYNDMKKKGVVPDEMFFSALIDVAGHAGNLDAAFEVLQEASLQGMNPGIISYSSLMGACSKTQNWEKALELFEQIKSLRLNPTVPTVNALITALCDADQMQKALDVLSEMKKLGLRPNDVTYSVLLMGSEKNDDLEVGLTLFSQAKEDGVPFNLIMCKCLTRMCSRRFENAFTIGEPVFSFDSGRPQIDSKWTSLALSVYREVIGSGLTPSVEMLAQVLRCLQLPQDVFLKKRLTETLGINTEKSKRANLLPLIDGFGEYDPRAFSLFEEAASLGIVPCVSFKESPIFIDASSLNIHIAKVYILTVLKGLKHRLAAGAKLPGITISLPVEMTDISCPKGDRTINLSGRVSQAVGSLLRRLKLPYQGSESNGKIRISALAVKRWLQPKLVASVNGKQPQLGLSQLRLASGITHQQRNIRTGNLSLY